MLMLYVPGGEEVAPWFQRFAATRGIRLVAGPRLPFSAQLVRDYGAAARAAFATSVQEVLRMEGDVCCVGLSWARFSELPFQAAVIDDLHPSPEVPRPQWAVMRRRYVAICQGALETKGAATCW